MTDLLAIIREQPGEFVRSLLFVLLALPVGYLLIVGLALAWGPQ